MRLKVVLALVTAVVVVGTGTAIASHVPVADPATVPTGFLAAHNHIADVPISAIARAAKPNGADVFVQHLRFLPNEAFPWHTHPGPVIATVVSGSLTYQDTAHTKAKAGCWTRW